MVAMRRLALLAVLAGAVVVPSTAGATSPCRDRIYNDWYRDGKIASTYPLACYRDAIKHVPNDARIYSSLDSDIRAALQAAIERSQGKKNVPPAVGTGLPSSDARGVKHATIALKTTLKAGIRAPDAVRRGAPRLAAAPVASTAGGGSGLPIPIIVLGALALVLAATGLVGVGVRRLRR
jgi:hypothetical protein